MSEDNRMFTVIIVAMVVVVIFGVTKCADYQRDALRYRSGNAYYECVRACAPGRPQ